MNATQEWWETFFRGPFGEWQAAGHWQDNTEREAEFIVSALGIEEGDTVLDVACGTGRHAIELAAKGVDVTGVDFNALVLAVARSKTNERGVSARFVEADMRCLTFRDQFDAAYCFWSSFGYFEDETHDLVVAKRIAEALRPGGRLLIDIMALETILPVFKERHTLDFDECDRQVTQETRVDFDKSRVEQDWTFVENGESRLAHASLRLYCYRELCDLLREAGFQSFRGLDSSTGEPFAIGASRLALVATL